MTLFQESGGSAEDHRLEAKKLVEIIRKGNLGKLTDWEYKFLESLEDKVLESRQISTKEIFKLRDIRDKIL